MQSDGIIKLQSTYTFICMYQQEYLNVSDKSKKRWINTALRNQFWKNNIHSITKKRYMAKYHLFKYMQNTSCILNLCGTIITSFTNPAPNFHFVSETTNLGGLHYNLNVMKSSKIYCGFVIYKHVLLIYAMPHMMAQNSWADCLMLVMYRSFYEGLLSQPTKNLMSVQITFTSIMVTVHAYGLTLLCLHSPRTFFIWMFVHQITFYLFWWVCEDLDKFSSACLLWNKLKEQYLFGPPHSTIFWKTWLNLLLCAFIIILHLKTIHSFHKIKKCFFLIFFWIKFDHVFVLWLSKINDQII